MTFRVTQLGGFGGGAAPPMKSVGSVAGSTSSANTTTHALGNIDVGAASGDKNIFLAITWEDGVTRTISSLTVGGVSLSEVISDLADSVNDTQAAIYSADISSINGVSAISVTFSGQVNSVGVSALAVSGLQSLTPTMSGSESTITSAQVTVSNLAAEVGGLAFGSGTVANQAETLTWGSLTEKADVSTGGSGDDHRHGAAWDFGFRAAADETLDATDGLARIICAAGYR